MSGGVQWPAVLVPTVHDSEAQAFLHHVTTAALSKCVAANGTLVSSLLSCLTCTAMC